MAVVVVGDGRCGGGEGSTRVQPPGHSERSGGGHQCLLRSVAAQVLTSDSQIYCCMKPTEKMVHHGATDWNILLPAVTTGFLEISRQFRIGHVGTSI